MCKTRDCAEGLAPTAQRERRGSLPVFYEVGTGVSSDNTTASPRASRPVRQPGLYQCRRGRHAGLAPAHHRVECVDTVLKPGAVEDVALPF